MHGTRYGRFKCAMCEAAKAAQQAMTIANGGDGPDAAQARLVGREASDSQLTQTESALHRIVRDHERARQHETDPQPRLVGDHNLVANLAGAIRRGAVLKGFVPPDPEGFVPAVQARFAEPEGPPDGGVSLDAIAASVRVELVDTEMTMPTHGAVVVATGALLMGMVVADRPDQTERIGPSEVNVLPPWEVSHPVLLDPILWLLASAYCLE